MQYLAAIPSKRATPRAALCPANRATLGQPAKSACSANPVWAPQHCCFLFLKNVKALMSSALLQLSSTTTTSSHMTSAQNSKNISNEQLVFLRIRSVLLLLVLLLVLYHAYFISFLLLDQPSDSTSLIAVVEDFNPDAIT